MNAKFTHEAEVSRIWNEYYKEVTGEEYIEHNVDGSIFGFITKLRPNNQSEILDILYEAGFNAGVEKARDIDLYSITSF